MNKLSNIFRMIRRKKKYLIWGVGILLALFGTLMILYQYPWWNWSVEYTGIFIGREHSGVPILTQQGIVRLEGKRNFNKGFEGHICIERAEDIIFEGEVKIQPAENDPQKFAIIWQPDDPASLSQIIASFNYGSIAWDSCALTLYYEGISFDKENQYSYFCGPAQSLEEALSVLQQVKPSAAKYYQ